MPRPRYDDYYDSESDDYNDRRPKRPSAAVTKDSYEGRRRDSRYYATHRRESRQRDESERRPKLDRYGSRDMSRRERRSSRVPDAEHRDRRPSQPARAPYPDLNPDSEARRRERRRQRRQERAARNPEQEAQRREERRKRRAARQQQQDETLRKKERESERPSTATDQESEEDLTEDEEPAGIPKPMAAAQVGRAPNDAPVSPVSPLPSDLDFPESEMNFREPYQPSRQQSSPRRYHPQRPRSEQYPRSESWHSSTDDWSVDLEDEKKNQHSRSTSMYDELQWYKRTAIPDRYNQYRDRDYRRDRRTRYWCGIRRGCAICGLAAISLIVLIIIIVVAVVVSKNSGFHYTPSTAQVNNTAAFSSGGATHDSVNDTKPGIGAGTDTYKYYQGNATHFPNHTLWISFDDMWKNNLNNVKQSCGWLNYGDDDSDEEITDIYNAIQDRANASLVDHRFILALVLQESHGCVRVKHTTSSGGVKNTGLMQAHHGREYDKHHSRLSIMEMIQDGTQGTKNGDGLVQLLNTYGNPYEAARGYNSGYIPKSGDLSEAAGATACYVSDVANRLTGWVNADTKCPGSTG